MNNSLENCPKVELQTTLGKIVVALYNETPKHRDNFLKLVNDGVYDGLLFHRVINEFMIQGGDVNSKNATPDQVLGSGDLNYTIEAEFVYPKYFHKKGALAAARTGDTENPERRSSSSQFYIVTGKKYTLSTLQAMKKRMENAQKQGIFQKLVYKNIDLIRSLQSQGDNAGLQDLENDLIAETEAQYKQQPVAFTDEQVEVYSKIGGTPHLDNQYTVFGEVVEGLEVVDKIQSVETGANDRPKEDVRIISAKVLEN